MYKESIENIMELSSNLNYTCRGIYIWPYDIKYKPKLYNFDESSVINVVRKTKDITEFKSIDIAKKPAIIEIAKVQSTVEIAKELNNEEKILYIVKTNEPDIYNVYDNEDVLNKPSIGIALVQTLSDSRLLRNSFRDKNAITNIKFVCIFVEKFKKWRALRPV
jgi:acyl-CoA hydrolase